MKTKSIFLTLFFTIGTITAQVKLNSNNIFIIGQEIYTPIALGSSSNDGVDNGAWFFEYWNNGLNLCKPWPSTNYGNYKLFIRDSDGYVGIGKQPSYKLDVDGDIATYGTLRISSDARLKNNIASLSDCMSKISKLSGKSYYKTSPSLNYPKKVDSTTNDIKFKTSQPNPNFISKQVSQRQLGLLAQDVKEIFPELVTEDSSGYMSIDYIGLIPVLIEALKEQNAKINALEQLANKTSNLKSSNIAQQDQTETINAELFQNVPNPFNHSTKISYFLSNDTKNAMIYIFNMNGSLIKNYPLQQYGEGSVTINAFDLTPGMYVYTLIADGKEVDTKRMILTE